MTDETTSDGFRSDRATPDQFVGSERWPSGGWPSEASPSEVRPFARPRQAAAETVTFDRQELRDILNLYGRKVAEGEWRDYTIDFSRETATFSIFRRASEFPLYRIEKSPKLARKQGAYSVVTATGLILKRGHELKRVLAVLDKKLKLVTS